MYLAKFVEDTCTLKMKCVDNVVVTFLNDISEVILNVYNFCYLKYISTNFNLVL